MTVHVALVHHPVRNREGEEIATSVTNIDVHDLARSCRTYGVENFWIVTPITAQHAIIERILSHWSSGEGRRRVPSRWEALSRVRLAKSVAEVKELTQVDRTWATAADPRGNSVLSLDAAKTQLKEDRSTLLLFGTGHGLADDLVAGCEALLPPIQAGDYNHLSVRAATAIILDRLFARDRA